MAGVRGDRSSGIRGGMKTSTLILTGLGVGVIAGALLGSPRLSVTAGGWKDGDAPRRIEGYARQVERLTGWSGLTEFLMAVAWYESRGDSSAINNPQDPNSAAGWFQLRPQSAMADRGDVLDEGTSVALAADYAQRLRKWSSTEPDWLALRRGWAYPRLVDDTGEADARSKKVRENFVKALDAVGVPRSFMYRNAFPSGFSWPGREELLSQMG